MNASPEPDVEPSFAASKLAKVIVIVSTSVLTASIFASPVIPPKSPKSVPRFKASVVLATPLSNVRVGKVISPVVKSLIAFTKSISASTVAVLKVTVSFPRPLIVPAWAAVTTSPTAVAPAAAVPSIFLIALASIATNVLASRLFKSAAFALVPVTVNLYAFTVGVPLPSTKAAFNTAAVSAFIVAVTTPVVASAILSAAAASTVPEIVAFEAPRLAELKPAASVTNTFVISAIFPVISTPVNLIATEVLPSKDIKSFAAAVAPFTSKVKASELFASFKAEFKAEAVEGVTVAATTPVVAFKIAPKSEAATARSETLISTFLASWTPLAATSS